MIPRGPNGSPCGDSSGMRPGGCSRAGEITDSLSVMALLHEAVRRLEGSVGVKAGCQMESEGVRFHAGSNLLALTSGRIS